MKKSLIVSLITLSILVLSIATFTIATDNQEQSIEQLCQDADLIVPVNLWVKGQDCSNKNRATDSTTINFPETGHYLIEGLVERGSPSQCQTTEEFYLEINGERGTTPDDDENPCAISTRLDFLGDFEIDSLEQEIIMHTDAQCPPDSLANSVTLSHVCLYLQDHETPEEPEQPETPEEPEPQIACYDNSQCDDKNPYTLDQCILPGTVESYCTHEPLDIHLEIISPTPGIHKTKTESLHLEIKIETNSPELFFQINDQSLEPYENTVTREFSLGDHTITAFAKQANGEYLSDKVEFTVLFVPLNDDSGKDYNSERKRDPYVPEEYFDGSGKAEQSTSSPIQINTYPSNQVVSPQNTNTIYANSSKTNTSTTPSTPLIKSSLIWLWLLLLLVLLILIIILLTTRRE